MSIYELIDSTLSTLQIPYYSGTPEFYDGDPPERYLFYSAYDIPQQFADGTEHHYEYTVTLNIVTPAVEVETRKLVRNAMKTAGFVYQSGMDTTPDDDTYPYQNQYTQEYKIIMEE